MRPGAGVRRVLLDGWPLVLALLLTLPLLLSTGHPLARDLVFVPHQPWTDASLGLGDTAPRAVPLDAVVSTLTSRLLDGGLVARIAIPLILATAGWGAHRLVAGLGLTARLAVGGFAVWNPYVAERLALGQWALLASYAALPWLVLAARRLRTSHDRGDLGAVLGWLGLASLTPTGGLIGSMTALAVGAGRDWRRNALIAGSCVVLQLTWLLPSLLTSAALTSDPDGVPAFAADGEGPGGVWTAVLGLGGIWDSRSVPDSRTSWWGVATAVVAVLALVVGCRMLARLWGRGDLVRLGALAAGGLVLVLLPLVPAGADLVRWAIAEVPGAGLLRDSQKFLAPYVVLVVAALGALVDGVARRAATAGTELLVTVALVAVPLPFLLLPDGASLVWKTVEPVHYPAGFDAVADRVDGSGGALATLPWRSYRAFTWGNGLVSSDPAVRWFDTDVLVSDDLAVGSRTIRGESERAHDLGADLGREPVAEALRANGVAWALVYRDDPDAGSLDLSGLEPAYEDEQLALYAVPGVVPVPGAVSTADRVVVVAADLLAAGVVLTGIVIAVRRRRNAHPNGAPLLQ